MSFFIKEKNLLPFFSTGLLNNFLHKNSLHILFIDCNAIYLYDLNKYMIYKHIFSSKIITYKEFYNSSTEKIDILIILQNNLLNVISCELYGFKIMHSIYINRENFFNEKNRPEKIFQIDSCNFIYYASITHFILFNYVSLKQDTYMWNDFHSDLKFIIDIYAEDDILFFQTANKKLVSAKFMQNKLKILRTEDRNDNCIIFSEVKIFFYDDCIKFKSIYNEKIMHFENLFFFNFHYFFFNENILFVFNGDGNILKITYETNGRYIDNIEYSYVHIAGLNIKGGVEMKESREKINNKFLNSNNRYFEKVEYKDHHILIITEKIFLIKIYAEENKIMQEKIFEISPPSFLNTFKISLKNIIEFSSIQKIRAIKKITDSSSTALFKNSVLFYNENLKIEIKEYAEQLMVREIYFIKNYVIICNSQNYVFSKENFDKRKFVENKNHAYIKKITIEKIHENGKYVIFMTEKFFIIADENLHKIQNIDLTGAVDQSYFYNTSLFICMKGILTDINIETFKAENLFLCKILIRLDEKELIFADDENNIYFYAYKNTIGNKKIKNDCIKIQKINYFLHKKFKIDNINEPIQKIELIDLPIDDGHFSDDKIEYNISLMEQKMENILLVFTDEKLFTYRNINGFFMRDTVLFIEKNHTVYYNSYFYFISPNIFISVNFNGISYGKSELEINFLCENFCIIDTHIFSYKIENFASIGDYFISNYFLIEGDKNFKNILFNKQHKIFVLLNLSTGYKFTMKAPEDRKVELIEENSTEISDEKIEESSIFNNFYYEAILYSHNFNFISKHKFSCNEIITDFKFLFINNGQEKKEYLVFCTSICRGENLQSTGRLIIYELIDVLAKIKRPFSNKKLKLVAIEETRLPITALCEIRNNIGISIGTKIMVYRLDLNEGLTPVAFHDLYILSNNIISVKNYIIASDILKGLFFFYYQSEPLMIHLLGQSKNIKFTRDILCFSSKKIMQNKNILCEKDAEFFFAVSTEEGEIYFYTYSPQNIFSKEGRELISRGIYKTPYKINRSEDQFYTENGKIILFDFYAMHDENINFDLKQFLNQKNIREHTFYENIIVLNRLVQYYLNGNSNEKLDELFKHFLK